MPFRKVIMPTPPFLSQNQLLAGLPDASLERLRPHLEPVELQPGETLFESGTAQTEVYFPVTSVVALSSFRQNGALIGISRIGNDGVVGIPFFLIGKVAPCLGVVHTAGLAYRLPSSCLAQEFNRGGLALRQFLRYAYALMVQMEQSALCHTLATLDQQDCARCVHAKGCALVEAADAQADVKPDDALT